MQERAELCFCRSVSFTVRLGLPQARNFAFVIGRKFTWFWVGGAPFFLVPGNLKYHWVL
jgi:hypothetical protein